MNIDSDKNFILSSSGKIDINSINNRNLNSNQNFEIDSSEHYQVKKLKENIQSNSVIQSQRTIFQSVMTLNPEKFNNDTQSKFQETCRSNRITIPHENLKDVII